MFDPKIKISRAVYDKVRVAAQVAGASSLEEFAERVLLAESEKVLAATGKSNVSADEIEQISNQMKGLGYLE